MYKPLVSLCVIAFGLLCVPQVATAQQTEKAKSKEKLIEKTGENKNVKLRNAVHINTPGDEFGSTFYKDGIVFSGSKGKATTKFKPSTDLFYASLDANLEPRKPSKFSVDLTTRLNEGAAVFSRDWNVMYFTQNNIIEGVEKPGRDKALHLKIFEAKRGPIDWMNKRELPFNSDNYSCVHPALSADGKTLYFASDMQVDGAQGGFDLYKVELINGVWSKPTNLGSKINTNKNEVFPFIYPSGDFYFSSVGHNSLGGYDIFRFSQKEGLVNLGAPFNSPQDDFGYILNDDGTRGLFTSNRPGGMGQDDIYTFTVETAMPGMERIQEAKKTIRVVDEADLPIQAAELRIIALSDGGFSSSNKDLYRTRLEKIDKNSNELRMVLVKLGAEELGQPDAFTNAQGEAIFDFKPYTEYLIWANNETWAAQANYRVKLDESDEKITIKLNVPTPKLLEGKLFNPAGHKIANAKLRFTNTETWTQDNTKTDELGTFAIAVPKGNYFITIIKDGFKPDYLEVDFDPEHSSFREFRIAHQVLSANKLDITEHIKPGLVFKIDKIEYELNSDRLDKKAQLNILQVVDMMRENPAMEIEINSHTDAQGSDKANLELSQRRANVVKDFIIVSSKNVISPGRIQAVGRGETQILNRCSGNINCADTEHAVNRRTEILVKKV